MKVSYIHQSNGTDKVTLNDMISNMIGQFHCLEPPLEDLF